MKKGIKHALAFFLIILIIALAPGLFGLVFKEQYLHLIDAINQDQRVKIDLLSYDEGWLTSTAEVSITILHTNNKKAIAAGLNVAPHFILKQHIIHGPIIYDTILHKIEFGYANIQSELHVSDPIEAALFGDVKDQGILQVSLLANFDGDWRGQFQFPIITLNMQEIGRLIWYGLNGDFKIIVHGQRVKHVVIAMQIGSIIMIGNAQNQLLNQLNIDPLTYTYDALHETSGLWSGNTRLFTSKVFLKKPDGAVFVLKDLSINSVFGITSKTFYNTNLAVNVENLNLPSEAISHFSQVHVLLSANDFSSENLNDYFRLFKNGAQKEKVNVNTKTMETLLIHTVIPTSFFEVDTSGNTSLGAFSAHARITWKPNAPSPQTLSDIIANSQTEVNVNASTPLAEKIIEIYGQIVKAHASKVAKQQGQSATQPANTSSTPQTPQAPQTPQTPQQILDEMLLGGFLIKEQNGYSTTLTIEDGVWRIRGRAISSTQ